MQRFLVITEVADANLSSYSPDLPGGVATGATREESESNMREAVEFHVEGLQQEGLPIPEPGSSAAYVAIG